MNLKLIFPWQNIYAREYIPIPIFLANILQSQIAQIIIIIVKLLLQRKYKAKLEVQSDETYFTNLYHLSLTRGLSRSEAS